MNEITIILIVAALALFVAGHLVVERKPFNLFCGILGTCSLAALLQDSTVDGTLMYLMAIVMVYVTLMSLAGAITRLEGSDA